VDLNEPNETSAAAFSLSVDAISDQDSAGGTFTGVALGTDVDWYTYIGSDNLGFTVDPTVQVVPADKVEVCMFIDCTATDAVETFVCPGGTTATADGALTGCCAATGFVVDDLCDTTDDGAEVFIRVKAVAADVCESYSISYHY
jgi:hypothetical protein